MYAVNYTLYIERALNFQSPPLSAGSFTMTGGNRTDILARHAAVRRVMPERLKVFEKDTETENSTGYKASQR